MESAINTRDSVLVFYSSRHYISPSHIWTWGYSVFATKARDLLRLPGFGQGCLCHCYCFVLFCFFFFKFIIIYFYIFYGYIYVLAASISTSHSWDHATELPPAAGSLLVQGEQQRMCCSNCYGETTGMVWRWNQSCEANSGVPPSTHGMWSKPMVRLTSHMLWFKNLLFHDLLTFSKIQEHFPLLLKVFPTVCYKWKAK